MDLTLIVSGLKQEIQVLNKALAALEMKSLDETGRARSPRELWSRAQIDQLSSARIALRAELDGAEFRLRIIEASNDRPRTRAERQAPRIGTDLQALMGHEGKR